MDNRLDCLITHARYVGRWSKMRDEAIAAARLADPTTRVIRVQQAREWNHELLWNLRHVSNIKRSLRESLQEVKP
jgi:hypothetical protein